MRLVAGFVSATDLYEKLKRDRDRLRSQVTPDAFFDFVVTAYSIFDWVDKDQSLPQAARTEARNRVPYSDQVLKVCRDLANSSKHFTLDRTVPITRDANAESGFGVGRYGVGGFGVGESRIQIILNDGTTYEALAFSDAVVDAWRNFLNGHGVTVT